MSESPPRETDADRASVPVRDRGAGYYRNGVWVPRDAEPDPQPPGWWERIEARFGTRWKEPRVWVPAAVVLTAVLVLIAVVGARSPARVPDEQRDFVDIVERGQTAVNDGNDLTLVTAARDRAGAICTLLPRDGAVKDWVGTLEKVGTVFGGKSGQVSVALDDGIHLRTWSRASQDKQDHTLVDPNSDVYRSLADLKAGAKVRFSGTFEPNGATCVHETSVFARNGMMTPSFVFRLTAVGPR